MPYDVSEHTKSVFETRAWEASLERARQRKLEQQEDEPEPASVTNANAENWAVWVNEQIDEKLTRAAEIIGGNVGRLNNEIDAVKCTDRDCT
jgi:hypothetical protein